METKIKTVQQCYAEFGKGNIPGVLDLLAEDVSWTDPGYPEIPYAGKKSGKHEVAGFFIQMGAEVTFTKFEPQQFFCDGNMVIVKGVFAGHGSKTGKAFETDWVMLWEVVDDKIKYYQAFVDTYNMAAALH